MNWLPGSADTATAYPNCRRGIFLIHIKLFISFERINKQVRFIHSIFLSLLILAIPVYGYAGLGSFKTSCPMASSMAGHSVSFPVDAGADDADCCHDSEMFAKSGQACKAGQECKAGSFGLSLPANRLAVQAPCRALHLSHDDRLLAPGLVNIWRPPAHL